MARRRLNPRLAKCHSTYSVEEAACTFGVHKNTIRRWIKQGLPTLDTRRPILIHGRDLSRFVAQRREAAKQPCRPGQIYCVACRAPKYPAGGMAELVPATPRSGNLRGLCPDCERFIYRRVSLAALDLVCGRLEITFTEAKLHIEGTATPSSNSDIRK